MHFTAFVRIQFDEKNNCFSEYTRTYEIRTRGGAAYINWVKCFQCYQSIHLHPLRLGIQLAMHFTLQTIVATFALLNICAYANPMKGIWVVNQAPSTLVTRQDWCGGFTDGDCQIHCESGNFHRYQCDPK